MIKFEKIQPGMILYDVRKSTYQFWRGKWDVWTVRVYEVDQEKRRVFASWNGNAPHWINERAVTKYRAKNPNEVNSWKTYATFPVSSPLNAARIPTIAGLLGVSIARLSQ